MRRTKIVATVGPASRSPQLLGQLVQAGVDVFRLNFSHGTPEEHLAVIGSVREIGARLHKPIALLQDLSGPKIRIGKVKDGVVLVKGARIAITTDPNVEGSAELISTTYTPLAGDVKPGDRILLDAKALVAKYGARTPVIAKIEKPQALDNLEAILAASDGVMVARGDLGVELGTENVPIAQKRIIAAANSAGRVVITATQMLESMIENPRPTRAEASDVANAILDGTDAVMLSGESAVGKFPVETVETMARIADYTEEHGAGSIRRRGGSRRGDLSVGPEAPGTQITRSLTRVAASVAEELGCKLIVAFTESGITARLLALNRPRMPVVAITHDERVYRQLALAWGVVPVRSEFVENTDDLLAAGEERLKARGFVEKGDTILMLSGHSPAAAATNMLRVHTVS